MNNAVVSSLRNVEVPSWAIKLTLPDDIIGRIKARPRKIYRGKHVTAYLCGFDKNGRLIGEVQQLTGYIVHVGDHGQNMTVIEASHFQPSSNRLEIHLQALDALIQSTQGISRIDLAIIENCRGHHEKLVIGWHHETNKVLELSEPSDDLQLVNRAFYSLTSNMRDRVSVRPRFLFKYEQRCFAESFFLGNVKITSAKDMENYKDPQRKDVESRKATHWKGISDIVAWESAPGIKSEAIDREMNGYKLRFDLDPYFAFCTSTVLTASLLDEFDKSDTVIYIHDPGDFNRRLRLFGCRLLTTNDDLCWAGCVSYERHQDFVYYGTVRPSLTHPAFMKAKQYEAQQEHRVVWITSDQVEKHAPRPTIVNMGTNEHTTNLLSRDDVLAYSRNIRSYLW